jgi:cytochrome P450
LRRICLESLRLTAHSIGGVRISKSPLTVSVKADDGNNTKNEEKHYNIPKGSTIAFAHIASSLDTSIWGEDAAVFNLRRPEDFYMDDYKFTTFSHGVHKCPGRELAMIQLQAVVAILLTEFDVSLPEPIPKLGFERATLAQRDGPVMVSIRPKQK